MIVYSECLHQLSSAVAISYLVVWLSFGAITAAAAAAPAAAAAAPPAPAEMLRMLLLK